jgi:hypothetical protein
MSRLLVALCGVALVALVGCNNMNHDDSDMHDSDHMNRMDHNSSDMKSSGTSSMGLSEQSARTTDAGADQCPHCPGVQKANADGTCPVCHMKVK